MKRSRVNLDIGIYWPLNIFWTLCLTVIKLDTLEHPEEKLTPVDFDVKGSRSRIMLDVLAVQYFWNPLLDRHITCKIHWYILKSWWPYWLWGQRSAVKLGKWIYWPLNFLRTYWSSAITLNTLVYGMSNVAIFDLFHLYCIILHLYCIIFHLYCIIFHLYCIILYLYSIFSICIV
jgi:hypothetical protein